jgi:hypothetical protein
MLSSRGGVAGEAVPEGGAAGNPRGNGKIINISSLVAYQGTSIQARYVERKLIDRWIERCCICCC